jgi:dihydrofolate reductase
VEGGYIDHWTEFARKFPDKAEFAFTKRISEARKVIFSRTLKETSELARHPLIDEVDDLKHQTGKTIVALGGAGFASSLIADDLVDEFQLYVNPIALHQGLSIVCDCVAPQVHRCRRRSSRRCGSKRIRKEPNPLKTKRNGGEGRIRTPTPYVFCVTY